jgi:hypothetical protein
MTGGDETKFGKLMVVLGETFGETLSGPRIRAYFEALADLDFTLVERAAKVHLASGRFFPKPAELREPIEGSKDDAAAGAWELVQIAFRKAGIWDSVCFDDRYIGTAILRAWGGWPECAKALHTMPEPMIAAKRKEFLVAYKLALREERQTEYLPGYHEINNRINAGKFDHGMLVGEDGRATYTVPFRFINSASCRLAIATFDTRGQMVGTLAELANRPARFLPGKEPLALPAPAAEPEAVKTAIQVFAQSRSFGPRPIQTDEEWEARREFLKHQAQKVASSAEVNDGALSVASS